MCWTLKHHPPYSPTAGTPKTSSLPLSYSTVFSCHLIYGRLLSLLHPSQFLTSVVKIANAGSVTQYVTRRQSVCRWKRSSLRSLGFLEAHLLFVTLVSTLINSTIRYKNRIEHCTSEGKSSRMQKKVKERMDRFNAGGRRDIERQLQEGGRL
jgi:hypothetical protein